MPSVLCDRVVAMGYGKRQYTLEVCYCTPYLLGLITLRAVLWLTRLALHLARAGSSFIGDPQAQTSLEHKLRRNASTVAPNYLCMGCIGC
jgi:hypothetical protein